MVPDAEQMKQILAGIAGQLDQQTTPALLSLSVRPSDGHTPDTIRDVGIFEACSPCVDTQHWTQGLQNAHQINLLWS